MVKTAVIGLGKMGLSHLAIIRTHPKVDLVGVCDPSKYLLDILSKQAQLAVYSEAATMLDHCKPDAVIIATPSRFHGEIVRTAIIRGIHVFCEKPFSLDPTESRDMALQASRSGIVNQVGYHYRFVETFQETKRLLDQGAIGTVTHVLAEAYGPVVLQKKGLSWRTQKLEGGGCLYDYAAHPVNLLNWYFGIPDKVSGSVMTSLFSRETDDEVYCTLSFPNGPSAQLSVNWSDESVRKMTVRLNIWGTAGRIIVDRQECQTYIRRGGQLPSGYTYGWNSRYTTDLTKPVWYYVRGEEYSAQLDYFIQGIESGRPDNVNSFDSAAITDKVLSMIRQDAG